MAFDANHVARGLAIYRDLAKLDPVNEEVKIIRAWDTHREQP
jgi:hypothetical protein